MEPVRGRVESLIQQATLALDKDSLTDRVKHGERNTLHPASID
jgi:hypothetical protein